MESESSRLHLPGSYPPEETASAAKFERTGRNKLHKKDDPRGWVNTTNTTRTRHKLTDSGVGLTDDAFASTKKTNESDNHVYQPSLTQYESEPVTRGGVMAGAYSRVEQTTQPEATTVRQNRDTIEADPDTSLSESKVSDTGHYDDYDTALAEGSMAGMALAQAPPSMSSSASSASSSSSSSSEELRKEELRRQELIQDNHNLARSGFQSSKVEHTEPYWGDMSGDRGGIHNTVIGHGSDEYLSRRGIHNSVIGQGSDEYVSCHHRPLSSDHGSRRAFPLVPPEYRSSSREGYDDDGQVSTRPRDEEEKHGDDYRGLGTAAGVGTGAGAVTGLGVAAYYATRDDSKEEPEKLKHSEGDGDENNDASHNETEEKGGLFHSLFHWEKSGTASGHAKSSPSPRLSTSSSSVYSQNNNTEYNTAEATPNDHNENEQHPYAAAGTATAIGAGAAAAYAGSNNRDNNEETTTTTPRSREESPTTTLKEKRSSSKLFSFFHRHHNQDNDDDKDDGQNQEHQTTTNKKTGDLAASLRQTEEKEKEEDSSNENQTTTTTPLALGGAAVGAAAVGGAAYHHLGHSNSNSSSTTTNTTRNNNNNNNNRRSPSPYPSFPLQDSTSSTYSASAASTEVERQQGSFSTTASSDVFPAGAAAAAAGAGGMAMGMGGMEMMGGKKEKEIRKRPSRLPNTTGVPRYNFLGSGTPSGVYLG